ncbi:MAG: TIGR04053 family radical SAM/SPASM domain-containing protein [Candidatus Eremiobacteraeota bacterium]|nr:TIGR04053 family radical SAM/SPASM domain-containing protein [Candidatus Eremiobacteraeota bacterium]MCW5869877.1 TIGR04053 family radical SAM/SPASM domain-containing protein [Candidatus Eremiobacteraeota bacterium]
MATSDRPFLVIWEVTQACDLACSHCRASAMPEAHPLTLNGQQGRSLIEQVRDFGPPYPLLVFTGGDPFKRTDLLELVGYARSLGLSPAISPSATPLLTRERLEALRDAGARVASLSLDGSTAEVHDSFRGVAGTFERTLEGCATVRDLGMKLQINSTVSRHNMHDLPELAALVYRQRVMTWSVFFLVATGRAQSDQALSPAELEAVMHWLAEVSSRIPLKTTEGHHYKRVLLMRRTLQAHGYQAETYFQLHPLQQQLQQKWRELCRDQDIQPRPAARRLPMHINSGDGFVFVSHLGEVFPSGFLPLRAGNVKTQSLVDVYRNSPLFGSLRDPDRLKGRCGSCEFRQICGGSRSRAFAMSGDELAEDPSCSYQPGSFKLADPLARDSSRNASASAARARR